jgi:hypothetical protein
VATIVNPSTWQPVGVASLGPVASDSVPARAEIPFTPQFTGHRCIVGILAGRVVLTLPGDLFTLVEGAIDPAIAVDRGSGNVRLEVPPGSGFTLGRGTLPGKSSFPCTLRLDLERWPEKPASAWVRQLYRGEVVGRVNFRARAEAEKEG